MKENKTLYELTLAQEVPILQCKYTIFKKVINILASVETKQNIDADLMKKAFDIAMERNDCTRLRFVKQDKKLMQYFEENVVLDIPRLTFTTKEEQDAFIKKQSKGAIKWKKGEVIKPFFIKTFDGKFMIFLKICHVIFDIYGLNFFINDLFSVYHALEKGEDLPAAPKKYEDLIKKDLVEKYNIQKHDEDYEYFEKQYSSNPEPFYAGFDGLTNKTMIKTRGKGQRPAKMFFFRNSTKMYGHEIPQDVTDKLLEYAKASQTTIANLLFYLCSVTQSRMNGDVPFMLPLELCNCRGTLLAKKCGGTKVQSLACLTEVNKDLPFSENLKKFVEEQNENYRHIGLRDMERELQLHRIYKTSVMSTYYSLTFSFIPYSKASDFDVKFYSNERCALPAYVAVMYNIDDNSIGIGYDCQVNLITEKDVEVFHKNLISAIEQVTANPDMLVKDITLKEKN